MQRANSSAPIYSSSAAAGSSSLFPLLASSSSRPTTRDGPLEWQPPASSTSSHFFSKDRKASFSRKASFTGSRRRGSSSTSVASSISSDAVVTDAATPPALPDYALSAAAKVFPLPRNEPGPSTVLPWNPSSPEGRGKMLGRTTTGMTAYLPPDHAPGSGNPWQDQASILYQQMTEMANKRISTLDYLRRA